MPTDREEAPAWQRQYGQGANRYSWSCLGMHYAEVLLETFTLAIPSLDNSTVLCLPLSSLIVNPLILQNTSWSYKVLVSLSIILQLGLLAKAQNDTKTNQYLIRPRGIL